MEDYIVEKRYQHWGSKGIDWTKWFVFKRYKTLEEAKEAIKVYSKKKEPKVTRIQMLAEYRLKDEVK